MTPAKYDILIVGGYGHIGLPMGIVLADAGWQVALYDIDRSKTPIIASGKMPFLEYDAEPILQRVIGKTLHLEESIEAVSRADTLIVTIGTPVDEYLNPRLMPIFKLAEDLLPYLHPQQLIMLRSTIFPGTMNRLHEFLLERGCEIEMAFCPERIVQGYAIREFKKLPQIVSGFSPTAVERSETIFQRSGQETLIATIEEAELTKLFSNAWRYIQFATANQFYMIASANGADFQRIHHLMTHNYDRAMDFPKAGFTAGPCLLKDTMQLSAFYSNNFMLGHSAMLINEGLPAFIIGEIEKEFDLTHEVVGILGMAFKANSDDTRDSLSYKLRKLLVFKGATVLCSDEFIADESFVSAETLLDKCSILILAAPHRAYRALNIPSHIHTVDVWGFLQQAS
jgi:UDP-N-acetyl-D-mannosaminuronic acid dehydrogenase